MAWEPPEPSRAERNRAVPCRAMPSRSCRAAPRRAMPSRAEPCRGGRGTKPVPRRRRCRRALRLAPPCPAGPCAPGQSAARLGGGGQPAGSSPGGPLLLARLRTPPASAAPWPLTASLPRPAATHGGQRRVTAVLAPCPAVPAGSGRRDAAGAGLNTGRQGCTLPCLPPAPPCSSVPRSQEGGSIASRAPCPPPPSPPRSLLHPGWAPPASFLPPFPPSLAAPHCSTAALKSGAPQAGTNSATKAETG